MGSGIRLTCIHSSFDAQNPCARDVSFYDLLLAKEAYCTLHKSDRAADLADSRANFEFAISVEPSFAAPITSGVPEPAAFAVAAANMSFALSIARMSRKMLGSGWPGGPFGPFPNQQV